MMKRTMNAGWLVVAAALMIGMTACSNDYNITEEPTVPTTEAQGVQVTVSAGLNDGNGPTTRAEVAEAIVEGKTQRTLKFTTGDRLYISRWYIDCYLNGILTMDGEPTDGGLGATFSGTLKAYNNNNEEITNYDYASLSDPLSSSKAILIPSGAAAGCFNEANHMGAPFVEQYSLAADVNTLMTTALYVVGTYNGSGYTLTKQKPILNCNLGGLTAGTVYSISLKYTRDQEISPYEDFISYTPTVTADGDGNVHFAISGDQTYFGYNFYWQLQLDDGVETYDYTIGQKQFAAKVYNLTRATPDVPTIDSFVTTASFGLNFSVFPEGVAGMGMNDITNVQAPSVTISGIKGNWTVTPTAPATYFSQNASGLTKGINVDPGETLTFTATGVSYDYGLHYTNGTFIGTASVPNGEIGATLDLGTIRMTKQ